MRGKVWSGNFPEGFTGITPAYAGKRQKKRKNFPANWDHPRLCGEKPMLSRPQKFTEGSPPPMRGKVLQCGICGRKVGITPAYAGKRLLDTAFTVGTRDHPRLCGEKSPYLAQAPITEGSPPPMRGKGSGCCRTQSPYRDHPRLCGEKARLTPSRALSNGITPAYAGKSSFSLFFVFRYSGSPPPMRGKEQKQLRQCVLSRITPAYAGKSSSVCTKSFYSGDHPRLCGEKIKVFVLEVNAVGSPPPMRGKVVIIRAGYGRERITPAYAGKSLACYHLLYIF